ncbi:TetR/AcrR family transcriptional regulator [Phytoactinopolyspora mesophila]|uniref:TetR family transcriptional regulator n=1 Tax=Phytoactinopolyspora mesophila TaxID=2650750 RepID=A0A7K3M280_9ACTN|nr:TetR family transcriptional regulator [Phytoactinopolyspora mesophila]NDL57406.1 TetR family transcriptional regulator [Phytoactinopolyspora mesophila]
MPESDAEDLVGAGIHDQADAGTDRQVRIRRGRGPNDPHRRDRIARAAISVVAEHGIEALTHRRVAAAAGVPLGSTTYHFSTLDDLVGAALEKAAERSVSELWTWERSLEPDVDLAAALAEFVVQSVGEKRRDTMAEYNLYAVALHRPHLRKAAVAWDNALAEVLQSRTDALTGRMVAVLLCGLLMQAVLSDDVPAPADIEVLIRRALDGPAAS